MKTIFICNAGTHWTDEIIRKLKFQGVSDPSPQLTAPLWVDFYQQRQIALDKISQYPTDHRRVLLTHLPLHSIQYSTKAKYIFVSRDGRDVFLSLARHYANISPARYEYINSNPNRIGDPFPTWDEQGYTIPSFFDDWINKGWNSEYRAEQNDGYAMWSFFDVVKSYWDFNHLENVLFVNYIDLISDLDGSIRRMAKFLEIPIQEDNFADLVQSLTFEGMKAAKNLQQEITSKDIFKEGVTILNKGRTENWKTELTEAQLARYDEVLQVKLSSECIRWLVGGVSSLG